MTATQFRRLALSLPEAEERAHMGHPDFRVGGKIFATLGPGEKWGMVKLTPEEQASLIASAPEAFHPASGAWGRRGCTIVRLHQAKSLTVRHALLAAWRNTAPKRLVERIDEE
jgi:hypothetical protein